MQKLTMGGGAYTYRTSCPCDLQNFWNCSRNMLCKCNKYKLYNLRKYFRAFWEYRFHKTALSLRQTISGKSHTSRTSSGISKMRHFTINLVVNIIGAILFLVMGIALIVVFWTQPVHRGGASAGDTPCPHIGHPHHQQNQLMLWCRRRTLTTGTPSSFALASWPSSLLASSSSALGRWPSTIMMLSLEKGKVSLTVRGEEGAESEKTKTFRTERLMQKLSR